MIGMRLSALRSLFCCRGRVNFWNGVVVVGRARARESAARTIFLCPRANAGGEPSLDRDHSHLSPLGRGRAEGAGEGASP